MATVTRENIASLNDKLIVNITKEDYLPAFEKSLKQYAKTANIPGFRKGMVPTGVIKKMHGQGILSEQVFQAVDKAVNDYIRENKLEIIGQPLPYEQDEFQVDVNNPQDYLLNFEVGLQPELNIDAKNIKVTRYKIDVSDKTIEEEFLNAQRRAGEYINPETIEDEDTIINTEVALSDKEGNIAEDAAKGNSSLTFKDFSKKGAKAFKGKKVEDAVTIKLSDAFEDEKILDRVYSDLSLNKEEQQPKDTFVTFKITKIGLMQKAEVNEEFFKKVFPDKEIKNEEEFKAELKKDIQAYFDGQSNAQMQDQIYHELVDHTKIEFPEAFLKRWLKVSGEKPKTDEEVENEYPGFEKQLQWALISSKLSADNNIQVEPDEIKEFAKNQLMQYLGGQLSADANADWVNDYADRMLNDRKFIEDAHGQIRISKLFNALSTQVNATEETITEEAFNEIIQNHHHH